MVDWVRNLLSPRAGERIAGAPTSSSGASSSYLWWELPYGEQLVEVSVTLVVTRQPAIDRLVTFGIQSALVKPGGSLNLGLQHHPRFPEHCALLWDGYNAKGVALPASDPRLYSAIDDEGVLHYPWSEGVPYHLSVAREDGSERGRFRWVGSVTNQATGEREMIRELFSDAPFLRAPVLYIESFAPCDGPMFEARWSNATAVSEEGGARAVRAMRADYQPHAAGGCTNTNTIAADDAFVQTLGQMRTTRPGTALRLD